MVDGVELTLKTTTQIVEAIGTLRGTLPKQLYTTLCKDNEMWMTVKHFILANVPLEGWFATCWSGDYIFHPI